MADRARILRAWLFAMGRLEIRLRAEQGRARNAMIRQAAGQYEKLHHPPAHVFIAHQNRVRGILLAHYQRTMPVFARMALAQIKSRPRYEVKQALSHFEVLMQEWAATQALRKARLIADTDRDDVLAAISRGLEDGLGVAEIAREIRKVSAFTSFRAATIARTETHAAATYGSIESVRQAERELGVVMVKEWLATHDDRTREDHRAADGQRVGLDEKFSVGGVLMDRPGDPSAPPDSVINCRCSLVYSES